MRVNEIERAGGVPEKRQVVDKTGDEAVLALIPERALLRRGV
jgi:hypothetical protein